MSTGVHQNTAVSKTARRLRKLLRELMNVRHLTRVQDIPHRPPQCHKCHQCVFIATLIVSLTLAEIGAGYPSRGTATVPQRQGAVQLQLQAMIFIKSFGPTTPFPLIGEGTLSTISQPKNRIC